MVEQLASFAEFIGTVGVIVPLIYVGKQLKQSNATSRAAFRQSYSSQANEWAMGVACSPELAEAIAKVQLHGLKREEATDLERVQIGYALFALLCHAQMAFEHWKEGQLTERGLNEIWGSMPAQAGGGGPSASDFNGYVAVPRLVPTTAS